MPDVPPDPQGGTDDSVLASVRRRLLRGSSWVLLARIVGIPLGLFINAMLARLLTQKQFGTYFTSFTLVIVGSLVCQLGLDRAVVRLVSQSLGVGQPGRARHAIRRVLGIGSVAGVALGGLFAFVLGPWYGHHVAHSELVATVAPITGGWLIAFTIQSLFVETFRGLQKFARATIYDTVIVDISLATVFGVMYAVGARTALAQVIAISAGVTAVVAAIAGVLLRTNLLGIDGEHRLERNEIFDIAWPSLLTNVSIYFLGSGVDLLVLGAFRPQSEVALYGAAARIVTLVATPLWILRGVLPPMISELHAQGRREELERTLRAGATLAGLPSFAILVVFLVLGRSVMGHLYRPAYAQAATILAILSFGRMVAVWAGACGVTLMMTGHQKAMMVVTVCTGLLSVALGMSVAGRFGGVGVAIATMSVAIVQNGLQLALAKRYVGVWTHMEFSPRALKSFFRRKPNAAAQSDAGPGGAGDAGS